MNPKKTFATTKRVFGQLKHDKRTLGLVFVVPPMLLLILKYVFQSDKEVFNTIAPMLLGVFPMIVMFLITSIVTLRERRSGTLDRLMSMPVAKLDFILGYAVAFCVLGLIQAIVTSLVMLDILHVTVLGGVGPTLVAAGLAAFLGTSLGLFTSAFASSEFQAVQFLPAIIFPQLLTCGLFVARSAMAWPLQWFSDIMPLTYSVDAMKQVTENSSWTTSLTVDLLVVTGFAVTALLLGSATIRRQELGS